MCRFLVYKGSDEILLSKLILEPTHSILKQSFDSRLRLDTRRGQNNADGFGIGFYTNPKLGAAPCLFTSTTPAWNSPNLNRLASKTASRLIFAHVRATTEGSLSEDNCHPFYHGSLMWMHNGGLGGWKYIKRRLGERLADRWYLGVVGGTDSEWAFALFLDTLERMGYDPSAQPEKGFGPTVLRRAMLKTIELINELIDDIPESIIQAEKVDTRSLLNFALTDGHSIICTRYVSSATDEAASLYYSSGSQWENRPSHEDECNFQMERRDKGADVVLVASEPLTFERENWVNVPTNSILTIHGQTVMVHPIMDQFSNHSPYHTRSAAYVQMKGLSANEKLAMTPALEDAARVSASAIAAEALQRRLQGSAAQAPLPYQPRVRPTVETSLELRSVTQSKVQQQQRHSSPNPPSQGNIKKKRRSLNALERSQGDPHRDQDSGSEPPTPSEEPPRNNFGDPNKIAQYFPELTLS
ncbi:hypothetical protein MGG_11745 [Pyricularia oryzae 70-15]|uniref:Glutamine amidotransferase type-2 domain-containing protein n=1 Tax=Pyricularia oryzae (strain 70-15 / ATCC MYA-4617 / FGSC 8958) TaxID=242507 RepID=G4MQ98_PYRO7|nr:uncharacterized protein MGG_11745 [Pyricularia oryzae 70-15]EHA57291.1 hypothetical protein MGG_11745 [Pyricularia oryzae 70-15]